MIRRSILTLFAAFVLSGVLGAAPNKPKTVIHVITVKWSAKASPEAIQKAIRGAETMEYPGLVNVWTRPIKKQLPEGFNHIIVMEFKDEAALKNYADSPAQKKWYEAYMAVREESATHDITN
jgi:antibiotic biosynthesis monooxygenase (ABM) superfamily enzyme